MFQDGERCLIGNDTNITAFYALQRYIINYTCFNIHVYMLLPHNFPLLQSPAHFGGGKLRLMKVRTFFIILLSLYLRYYSFATVLYLKEVDKYDLMVIFCLDEFFVSALGPQVYIGRCFNLICFVDLI